MSAEDNGVRKFRTGLASYIDGDQPVAVTCHGKTVGLFRAAASRNAAMLAARSSWVGKLNEVLNLDNQLPELLTEFKKLRTV